MSRSVTTLLEQWLRRLLPGEGVSWLQERRTELAERFSERALHITLGMIPRKLGKADLALSAADLESADRARAGWDPTHWSITDAARVLVLLETAGVDGHDFAHRLEDLCRNADVGELISFYRGLPLYPEPDSLEHQAAEGLRTNMRSVFEAVAHASPYPREVFTQRRWNQMVLKALFVDSTLAPIQGLDQRANAELATILCDYAHERWAAGRRVRPELWRCVGPFATGTMLDDLARVLDEGEPSEREAAALALTACRDARAESLLARVPDLAARAATGAIRWEHIAQQQA